MHTLLTCAALSLSLGLAKQVAPTPSPSCNSELLRLERELSLADDPTFRKYDSIQEKMRAEIQRVFFLTVDGKHCAPNSVFFGGSIIAGKYELDGLYADDTAHTTEFPPFEHVPLRKGSVIHVTYPTTYARPVFGVVDDCYSHSGYEKYTFEVRPGRNDILRLPAPRPKRRWIVFVILRGPGESLYKKLVWVFKRAGDPDLGQKRMPDQSQPSAAPKPSLPSR